MSGQPKRVREPGDRVLKPILITLEPGHIHADGGVAYGYQLPASVPAGDNGDEPFRSTALLFDDGVALGPAHVMHEQVRAKGGGRFSHWLDSLFFSTSDNSSPIENGRQYHLMAPARLHSEDAVSAALRDFAIGKMAPMERFQLAREFYHRIWERTPLPDHGRRIDQDTAFAEDFARISPDADVTYERKYNLDQLFQLVRHIGGDVAECGAYKGASAFFLARHIVKLSLAKRLCLFDSFEGLSSPDDIDGNYWYKGALEGTMEDIRAALAPLGPTPFVEFYKGWIPERFQEVADRSFCFVHIDVDLYQPTLDSIAFFYPRMTAGGIVLLDDYGFASCPGVTAAIDRFMADKREPIVNLAAGGAFIMRQGGV
jgi:hypothetical protein